MRLDETNTVDYLGFDKETGIIQLTLVDDCDWSDERRHIQLLQSKIYRYLDFVKSGEVYDRLRELGSPVSNVTPVNVQILAKHALEGRGQEFVQFVTGVARSSGAGLSWKHVV